MALPKYTAQLKDQLEHKRTQAVLLLIIIDVIPILAVQYLVQDKELMELIFVPLWDNIWKWFILIYSLVILIHVLLISMRISQLSDTTQN